MVEMFGSRRKVANRDAQTGFIPQLLQLSKWNKIEHRMFCHITSNWRGRPLESREVVVNLIANTQTSKGLTIQADLNVNSYAKGIRVPKQEISRLNLKPADFQGEWNYMISTQP